MDLEVTVAIAREDDLAVVVRAGVVGVAQGIAVRVLLAGGCNEDC